MTPLMTAAPAPQSAREHVAAEVRAALARRKIPAYKLSDQLGMTRGYWAPRVAGKQPFTVDDLAQIASLLGVPIDSFFSGLPVSSKASHSDYNAGVSLGQRRPPIRTDSRRPRGHR